METREKAEALKIKLVPTASATAGDGIGAKRISRLKFKSCICQKASDLSLTSQLIFL